MKQRPALIQQNKLSYACLSMPPKQLQQKKERVVLVYANMQIDEDNIQECSELIHACDMELVQCFTQNIKQIHVRTYIGKGKCEEIRTYVQQEDIDNVIFAHSLSPLQIRNLEALLEVSILDRTELILAIFAKRAHSPIAKLQVESAQLKKLLPRLIGANSSLGRQSASGKNKGSGEKQLELDRRKIKARIHEVDRELKQVAKQRLNQRRARQKATLPYIALCGYTNAGKSTIMNQLLNMGDAANDKHVLAKDMLFATLDTSIRHVHVPAYRPFLLSDTVGFVNDLPHELVDAFHSTLEEITYADLILLVVDARDPHAHQHLQVTNAVLKDLDAHHIPMLTVWNKCDQSALTYPKSLDDAIYISALENESLFALLEKMEQTLFGRYQNIWICLPYEEATFYQTILHDVSILSETKKDDGIHMQIRIPLSTLSIYKPFIIHNK